VDGLPITIALRNSLVRAMPKSPSTEEFTPTHKRALTEVFQLQEMEIVNVKEEMETHWQSSVTGIIFFKY